MEYWDRVNSVLREFPHKPGQEIHMGKKHIFLDYDLTKYVDNWEMTQNDEIDNYIGPSHRIHIFFARPNDCIFNDNLRKFIELCGTVTNRKVIIHVLKDRDILVKLIKGTVYDLDNCMVIEEDKDKTSLFVNKNNGAFLASAEIIWRVED